MQTVQLTCPLQLGHLKMLQLKLSLSISDLNLGWVASQPCSLLAVVISIDSLHDDLHAAIVQQLRRCQLGSLTLHLLMAFTSIQSMWGQLAIEGSL